jgi:tetratricopeptide (TPR) repeat protein
MSNRANNFETSGDAVEPLSTSGAIRSRDEIVRNIAELYEDDDALLAESEEHQLRRLIQTLRNRKGRFGLIFAVSNEMAQRKRLTQQIKDSLYGQHPVEIQLTENDDSLLEKLLADPAAPEPLIVYGIENLLPSIDRLRARREQTLGELQLHREQFRNLGRPLLLWMPEYVYTMIGQQAVDFWSWQGGAFFFTASQVEKSRFAQELGWHPGRVNNLPDLRQFVFNFEGREAEIEKLLEALRAGKSVAIQGVAGIGKSSLALYLAKNLINDYPDAQLFISLKSSTDAPRSAVDGLREALLALRPTERPPDNVITLASHYRAMLSGKRALIVLNDAPDPQSATLFLPPQGSVVIMTSRQSFTLPEVTNFRMAGLSPDEARNLLLRIAPRIGGFADEIARQCEYVPLALRLVASAFAHNKIIRPEEMAQRLKEKRTHLDLIPASLSLSLDLLENEELKRQRRMLAVFPDSFDAEAAAFVLGLEPDVAKDSLMTLEVNCLLEWNHETERYYLVDLIRDFALADLTDENRATAQRRHAIHYQRVLARANDIYLQSSEGVMKGLRLFDRERLNIQVGYNWATSQPETDKEAAHLCMAYANSGANILYLRQHPKEFIRWQENALSTAQHLNDKSSEGIHLGNLGTAYAALGETRKAIEFYEQALQIDREIGDRRGEGIALGNLGNAYANLGETRKAIEFYEQALQIDREIGDRRGEGIALGNLGNAYANLGETRKAIEFYEQALQIDREIGDRRGESADLGNLGLAYAALGETRKAIEFYEQALQIDREIGDRRGESADLGNLGNAYANLGETRKAIEFYEQRIAIAREIGGRRGEGIALGNLGNAYANLGETRKAIEFYEQYLAIAREIGDRQGEGNALGNLGLAYIDLGETRKALELMEASIKILEKIESPHANTVRQWLEKLRNE